MKDADTLNYTTLMPWRFGWFCGLKCDPCMTASIAYNGENCREETDLLRSLISHGDTVIDVGANVGTLSVPLALAVGNNGRVLAFEPQRFVYMCLCANVALNSLSHVITPFHCAVGKQPGVAGIPLANILQEKANLAAFSLLDNFDGAPKEPVQIITLDSLPIESCRLIKIDVEGMEPDVIYGAAALIKKCRPFIWAEQVKWREGTRERLVEALKAIDYVGWRLETKCFDDLNARGKPAMRPDTDPNVIAIPRGTTPPDWAVELGEVFHA